MMSRSPLTGEVMPFVLAAIRTDCIVEGQRPVNDASRDLASVGHFAKRRRIKRGRNFRCDRLHG